MNEDAAAQYRFGRFVVQPHERRLLADGKPVSAGPRAFDVLLALIERAGELVTKDELLKRVWPKLIVEENNLQVQVSALRKILGQDAIATIPGRGYRFTAMPQRVAQQTANPALRAHNLPQPLTSFVGHESDLADFAQTLEETRLLTLTGIGGCGKTRLAIELARMVVPSFPHGVWFVDLAPIAEPERIAQAIAAALALREEVGKTIDETLTRHLADRQLLLVLDNCEHVLQVCCTLVERFLVAAPGVRALITSREALGIAGERIVAVRPLASPLLGTNPDPAAVAMFEAVRLFVDRARHVTPSFALSASNAALTADICRRLEGIPLALELAAARTRLLSVEQIHAKLDDRFRLLTGNARAMSRHQTLLATLQWSYDHLEPEKQQLLRRLAVFAGGWTLDGAFHVGGEALNEFDVLDRLSRLVDQSLITIHRGEDGTTRYAMLETVRQYAHDRLHEAGEAEATRNRHATFFVSLAEQAESALVGPEQSAWFARLDAERENILAAHAWCDLAGDRGQFALRLAHSLHVYWVHRGLFALGHRVTVKALIQPDAEERGLNRCRALWAAAEFSYFMGRYAEARDWVENSLAIAREMSEERDVAEAVRLLGYVVLAQGNNELARGCFQEALALSRRLGEKRQLSRALHALAGWHIAAGERDRAEPLLKEGLALNRERKDDAGIAMSLLCLALVATRRGAGDRARAMLREALVIAIDVGSKRAGVALLGCVIELAAHLGDWDVAARLYGAFSALEDQIGHREEPDEVATQELVARTRDALGAAAFGAAENAGRALSYEDAIAYARAWLERWNAGASTA